MTAPIVIAAETPQPRAKKPPQSPYAGLEPYSPELKDYFIGRENDTQIAASNLLTSPLTIYYGQSGVGKTSVLLAGVVPEVEKEGDCVVVVEREWHDAGFSDHLKGALKRALRQKNVTVDDIETRLPFDEFMLRCGNRFAGQLLFIFDQFEEYFLYEQEIRRDGFDAELARAINRPEVRANFLICLREDQITSLDRLQGRIPGLLSNRIRLLHLSRADATRAIREPLAQYRKDFPDSTAPSQVEEALVTRILDAKVSFDRSGRGGFGDDTRSSDVIETPFLQLVLTALWEREVELKSNTLRLVTYEKLGGADQIVLDHVANAMKKRSGEEMDIAIDAFQYLVTPLGSKIAYTALELSKQIKKPVESVRALLDSLADHARIFRRVGGSRKGERQNDPRYELAHDWLAPAVLEWRADKHSERRERKFVRRGLAAGVLIMVVLLTLNERETRSFRAQALVHAALGMIETDLTAATALAIEGVRLSDMPFQPDLRSEEFADSVLRLTLFSQTSHTLSVKAMVDSRTRGTFGFLNASRHAFAASDSGIWIWDTATWEQRLHVPRTSGMTRPSIARSRTAAAIDLGNSVMVSQFDGSDSTLVWKSWRPPQGNVSFVEFTGGDRFVMVTLDSGPPVLLDPATGTQETRLARHVADLEPFEIDSTAQYAVGTDSNGREFLVDLTSGERTLLAGPNTLVEFLAFGPASRHLLVATDNQTVRIFDLPSRAVRARRRMMTDENFFVFSQTGERIISRASSRIYVSDAGTLRVVADHELSGTVQVAPKGNFAIVQSIRGLNRLSLTPPFVSDSIPGNNGVLSPNGDRFLSRRLSPSGRALPTSYQRSQAILFNTGADTLADTVRVWDTTDWTKSPVLLDSPKRVTRNGWVGDSTVWALVDPNLVLWSAASGRVLAQFDHDVAGDRDPVFDARGRHFLALRNDRTIAVVRVSTPTCPPATCGGALVDSAEARIRGRISRAARDSLIKANAR